MSPTVEAVDLGKRYGASWALRHCDLAVEPGRVVALVGPNGAGKSTLLSLVMGLTAPTCGTVSVGGLRAGSPAALTQVAFLAQDHPLYRRFTVRDHVRLGRNLNEHFDDAFAVARLRALWAHRERGSEQLTSTGISMTIRAEGS